MDYLVLSTLKDTELKMVLLAYDICCQYYKNFKSRVLEYDESLFIDFDCIEMAYAIPKFHLPAHGEDCHTRFSLNFLLWVGRTWAE